MPQADSPNVYDNPHAALMRLVRLRWLMLAGALAASVATPPLLGIALPMAPLLAVLAVLAGFNALTARRLRATSIRIRELCLQQIVDLAALGVLLFLSGGAANPLVSLLLLPVATAALTLPSRGAATVAALAVAIYSLLAVWFLPLPVGDAERAARLHLAGMWLTFVVSVALIAWLIVRMTTSVRQRDAALAQAREQALRDERVVALGALAAGAAHELGTPLATMAVIVGELSQDGNLAPAVREDLSLLRQQLATCKEIVSGLAQRAGAARPEDVRPVAATAWIEAMLGRWRASRPRAASVLRVAGQGDSPAVVVETTLEQALGNLLNNAADAGGNKVEVALDWSAESLAIAIRDRGAGFPEAILRDDGRAPVPSTTGGAGIGLMLARAAIERLGGFLRLANADDGGAIAHVTLPLARIDTEAKGI